MPHLIILNYHGVEPAIRKYIWLKEETPYVISIERFREHLHILERNAFQTIGLMGLDQWLDGNASAYRVILTFDDGHLSHYEYVAPELKARKMTGVFFIPVNLVGHSGHMDWNQLRELSEQGFEIGSHGLSHEPLTNMTHHELWKEMQKSKKILEEKIGKKVHCFSVPRGFYQLRIREVALELGYRFVFTSRFDVNLRGQDRYRLNRIAVKRNLSSHQFQQFIFGDLGIKRFIEKAKEGARRFLKPSFYDVLSAWKRLLSHG